MDTRPARWCTKLLVASLLGTLPGCWAVWGFEDLTEAKEGWPLWATSGQKGMDDESQVFVGKGAGDDLQIAATFRSRVEVEGLPPVTVESGEDEVLLGRVQPDGRAASAVTFGGLGEQELRGFVAGQDGSSVLVGSFTGGLDLAGVTATGPAGWLAAFDAEQKPRWQHAFQGSGDVYVRDAALDAVGNVYVVGTYVGLPSFGSLPDSGGHTWGFVASFDADGGPRWTLPLAGDDGATKGDVEPVQVATYDGGIYVAGHHSIGFDVGGLSVDKSGTDPDVFLVALDLADGAGLAQDATGGPSVNLVEELFVVGDKAVLLVRFTDQYFAPPDAFDATDSPGKHTVVLAYGGPLLKPEFRTSTALMGPGDQILRAGVGLADGRTVLVGYVDGDTDACTKGGGASTGQAALARYYSGGVCVEEVRFQGQASFVDVTGLADSTQIVAGTYLGTLDAVPGLPAPGAQLVGAFYVPLP